MPAPASPAGFPKLIYKHIQSLQVQSMLCHIWCHSCGHHAAYGVRGTVVTPHVVSQVLLLHGCGRCHVVVVFHQKKLKILF